MSAAQLEDENGKRVLHLFRLLGKFVARSMLDSRLIDVSFNPAFFSSGQDVSVVPSLTAVGNVDKPLAKSLKDLWTAVAAKRKIDNDPNVSPADREAAYQTIAVRNARIEDLGLDFTLPGYPHIELEPHGASKEVTIHNVEVYIDKIVDLTLGSGVQRQVEAFQAGFSQVFPYSAIKAFTPNELVMLFGHANEDWSLESQSRPLIVSDTADLLQHSWIRSRRIMVSIWTARRSATCSRPCRNTARRSVAIFYNL